jgi:hypothetical protein
LAAESDGPGSLFIENRRALVAAADHLVELVDGLDLVLLRREETKAIQEAIGTHRGHGLVE